MVGIDGSLQRHFYRLAGCCRYQPLMPSSETSLARYNVEVTNDCPVGDAVIIGTANNPDSRIVFGKSAITFGLDPADANVRFTQLNGRRLCLRSDRIGARWAQCLDRPVFLSIPPGDRNLVFCPDNPSRPGDLTSANTVRFQTSGSCAYIVRQHACYDWIMGPCEYAVYQGPQDTSFLCQASELRFKAVGEGWTEARLTVTGTDRGTVTYTQQRGEFVLIDVDMSAPV